MKNVCDTKKTHGFTLVEMIVVVIVIAILAMITIVAYNGAQMRAKNSQWATSLASWTKVIQLYKINTGKWPSTGAYWSCLGNSFPASDGFASNECHRTDPAGTYSASVMSSLMTGLTQQVGSLPDSNLSLVYAYDTANSRGSYVRGLVYQFSTTDTQPFIDYYQMGAGAQCIAGDTLAFTYNNNVIRCSRTIK